MRIYTVTSVRSAYSDWLERYAPLDWSEQLREWLHIDSFEKYCGSEDKTKERLCAELDNNNERAEIDKSLREFLETFAVKGGD